MVARMDGEVSTRQVAEELGIAVKTAARWAKEILSGSAVQPRGSGAQLTKARMDIAGRYYLDEGEVRALLDTPPADFF